jgi:streptogramin lyase
MDANLPTRRLLVALTVLPLLAGCAAGAASVTAPPVRSGVTAAPSAPAATANLPSPSSAQLTLIKGSGTCDVTPYTDKTVGANLVMVGHFRCQYA